jgi:FKBP-type peptidyl-prolyl cis-trans isomerase
MYSRPQMQTGVAKSSLTLPSTCIKTGAIVGAAVALVVTSAIPCRAVDPAELRKFARPDQVILLGGKGNLKDELESYRQAQTTFDTKEVPYVELGSGIFYREFREGKGSRTVQPGSVVTVEMTIRCESLTTGSEPGGVKYFSTQTDIPEGVLSWTIGTGQLPPGLEKGMMGMKRGAIRRIELPSVQVFAARDKNQLPLPAKDNADGNRRFKNLFKTKADLLFEVLVDKIQE